MCIGWQAGISAASSILGFLGQNQAADRQDAYNRAVYEQQQAFAQANYDYQLKLAQQQADYMVKNAESALLAQSQTNEAIEARLMQEELSSKVRLEQLRMERLKAVGALKAFERTGVSAQRMINDFYAQEGRYAAITQQNNKFLREQAVRQKLAAQAEANTRINEARPYIPSPISMPMAPQPTARPSLLGLGLQLGGAYLQSQNAQNTSGIPTPPSYDQLVGGDVYTSGSAAFDSSMPSFLGHMNWDGSIKAPPTGGLPNNRIRVPPTGPGNVGLEFIFTP